MSSPAYIEDMMRHLKLGSLARGWRSVEYGSKGQYMPGLPALETGSRKASRINQLLQRAENAWQL